ncbi:hypothetical protein [Salidesulfovibrio onnuriiensis]|uniref:hypothetical protein n=1 Tax=Salidesulfovibrio onnuriiensis TaxID=2583823 RepID=UPI0011C9D37A|nr:hypothetical protein [Salidesulfovibrio onnuriiensis]
MKRVVLPTLLFCLLLLVLPGCKKQYVGDVVSPQCGYGFVAPVTESRASYKNMTIDYTVSLLEEDGKYRFEGAAEMHGKAQSGVRIKSIEFRILLIRDNTIVDNIRLNARGVDPDQPMDLFKEFECKEGFDRLTFDWVIWYYH